jgi:predicted 3-demethylubiquinone-9 3-methyltransferase (glyoxalase superfamily)
MQTITPFLWFDGKAAEAAEFYTAIFKNSKIVSKSPGPDGKPMLVSFQLDGQSFVGLNGGPMFTFTEAVSFSIKAETQEEIDYFWGSLTTGGGQESRCGWLKDKFGLSWQVVPPVLGQLMGDKDPAKAGRVMQAMLKMNKIIIADLKKAYEG